MAKQEINLRTSTTRSPSRSKRSATMLEKTIDGSIKMPSCTVSMPLALSLRAAGRSVKFDRTLVLKLEGGMAHWTIGAAIILLASFSGVARAQPNCDGIPPGPARTDCYLGLSQYYRAQSDLAAARARAQSDAAWYRAMTGINPPKQKRHRRR